MIAGLVETERDMLIRTGVLTPFASLEGFERRVQGGARRERETIDRARDAAHHILSSRPSTRLLTGDQIPKQQVVNGGSLVGRVTVFNDIGRGFKPLCGTVPS